MNEQKPQPRLHAPRLPSDPALWLNTGGQAVQISPGTVFLLDFFTYCCINCLHVLPDLAYLEAKYRDKPFVVIGVHSGKFDNEKAEDAVRAALLRHGITHPVVRDDSYRVWREYSVRAWPTLVLIDARGYIVKGLSGEGNRAVLEQELDRLLDAPQSALTPTPSPVVREARPSTPLSFPGNVLADSAGGRLFIADTGNHRIVVAPLAGGNRAADYTYIGSGTAGLLNGNFAASQFRAPQGMTLSADGKTLYVTDTENHTIRRVSLDAESVETIAGTGEQKIGSLLPGNASEIALNSPWDVALSLDEQSLYIAMAGSHQIARLALTTNVLTVFAGTGREACVDGPVNQSAFAQPSGFALHGETLYVADAETSCIRAITLGRDPTVTTLAGSGGLFEFGNTDASGEAARFQHPLGADCSPDGSKVYVADTYNHTLRVIETRTGTVSTIGGGLGVLFEPGGVTVATNGTAYIADTNHHRVRRVALDTGAFHEFPLHGLCAPRVCLPEYRKAAATL